MKKKCTRCEVKKTLDNFCKNNQSKDKKCAACKECMYAKAREYKKNNRDKMNEYSRQWHLNNPEKYREAYLRQRKNNPNFRDGHRKRDRKYYQKNIEKKREMRRKRVNKHYYNHREDMIARAGVRRKRVLQATPPWVDMNELERIYKNKPSPDYHIDHIVPLNHPLVCGLHVPWNLQYLEPKENLKKSNKFEVKLNG